MASKLTYCVVLTAFILASCAALNSGRRSEADGQVDITATAASPNKQYLATVYTASGGGAAGYVYKVVSLRKRGEPFDPKKGIIFSATGTSNIVVMWEDDEHLTIQHSKPGSIYIQEKVWGNERKIRISYVTV